MPPRSSSLALAVCVLLLPFAWSLQIRHTHQEQEQLASNFPAVPPPQDVFTSDSDVLADQASKANYVDRVAPPEQVARELQLSLAGKPNAPRRAPSLQSVDPESLSQGIPSAFDGSGAGLRNQQSSHLFSRRGFRSDSQGPPQGHARGKQAAPARSVGPPVPSASSSSGPSISSNDLTSQIDASAISGSSALPSNSESQNAPPQGAEARPVPRHGPATGTLSRSYSDSESVDRQPRRPQALSPVSSDIRSSESDMKGSRHYSSNQDIESSSISHTESAGLPRNADLAESMSESGMSKEQMSAIAESILHDAAVADGRLPSRIAPDGSLTDDARVLSSASRVSVDSQSGSSESQSGSSESQSGSDGSVADLQSGSLGSSSESQSGSDGSAVDLQSGSSLESQSGSDSGSAEAQSSVDSGSLDSSSSAQGPESLSSQNPFSQHVADEPESRYGSSQDDGSSVGIGSSDSMGSEGDAFSGSVSQSDDGSSSGSSIESRVAAAESSDERANVRPPRYAEAAEFG